MHTSKKDGWQDVLYPDGVHTHEGVRVHPSPIVHSVYNKYRFYGVILG